MSYVDLKINSIGWSFYMCDMRGRGSVENKRPLQLKKKNFKHLKFILPCINVIYNFAT